MFKSILKVWLPLVALLILVCFIIYGTVQQTYRTGADDPQIQMAEEAVNALENGANPKSLLKANSIEISKGLLPYTIIYNENEDVMASDALLNGMEPVLPKGVLTFAKTNANHTDVLTWQPQVGIRSAIVVKYVSGSFNGFVITGRSLRLTEERESNLIRQILFGLVSSAAALLVFVFIWQLIFPNKENK
jgi:hypothetical protein